MRAFQSQIFARNPRLVDFGCLVLEYSPSRLRVNSRGISSCGASGATVDLHGDFQAPKPPVSVASLPWSPLAILRLCSSELDECVKAAGASTEYGVCCAAARAAHTIF